MLLYIYINSTLTIKLKYQGSEKMDYTTYWSVLDAPSHTIKSNTVCLVIGLGFGFIWLLVKRFKKDSGDGDKVSILWGSGLFALLGFFGYFYLTFINKYDSNIRTVELIRSPTTPRVEGTVSNFQRRIRHSKYTDETIESFTVDSVQFAYGDAVLARFNSFTETNNNVIFNGQKVRITYTDWGNYGPNTILKIEIAR